MKLIIREYLTSLKERGELDAILPDLLSQLGLNVFSRPARGTRQDGVDVAAVGKLDGKQPKVYLFAIKPGDLTRKDWSGGGVQDLRPSLTQILDAYIPNRLPAEHAAKEVVICICIGGDIQEQVRPDVEGYIKTNTKGKISFEQWNGDKLASLIQERFLREDLLPKEGRSRLRKSLAMLDEPETSYMHFAALIQSLSAPEGRKPTGDITAIRQIGICLWILFGWGRDAGNLESPYRCSELALLHAWSIVSRYTGKKTKTAAAVTGAFASILSAYQQISSEYLNKCVFPHADKRDAIASGIRTSSPADINLRLFDVLGRLAVKGLWQRWGGQHADDEGETGDLLARAYHQCAASTRDMISNNPGLCLPIADDQTIDISLAVFLLALDSGNHEFIHGWLADVVNRAAFAYRVHGRYPANLRSYAEVLDHPKRDADYRKSMTQGSILYPLAALWAALLHLDDLYEDVSRFKAEHLEHCNFQFWYPDDDSEKNFYTNKESHGATLSGACVDRPAAELVEQAFAECDHLPHFDELSAVKYGFWPIIAVACRHYRLPVPLDFYKAFVPPGRADAEKASAAPPSSESLV